VGDSFRTGSSLGLRDTELEEEFCLGFQAFIVIDSCHHKFAFAISGQVNGDILFVADARDFTRSVAKARDGLNHGHTHIS